MSLHTTTTARLDNLEKKRMSEEINRRSPDGRPAHPETGPKQIGGVLLGVTVLITVLAIVLAFVGSPVLGIGAGILALLFLITNPVAWASLPRAEERAKAEHDIHTHHAERDR